MEYELITYFSTIPTMKEILELWDAGTSAEQQLAKMIRDYGDGEWIHGYETALRG